MGGPPIEGEALVTSGFGAPNMSWGIPLTDWGITSSNRRWHHGGAERVGGGIIELHTEGYEGDSGGPVISLETSEVVGIVSQKAEAKHAAGSPTVFASRVDSCASAIELARSKRKGPDARGRYALLCDDQ
jgi:hypothetical protein